MVTDTQLLVPRVATLDGFIASAAEGVHLHTLPPMTSVRVQTRAWKSRPAASASSPRRCARSRARPKELFSSS
jgi:hypothetical protein